MGFAASRPAGVVLALCLVLLLLARRAGGGPSNPPDAFGRVYLLRGQGWFFSNGFRVLRDRLRAAGVKAEDVSDHGANWVIDDILADKRVGQLRGPIVFVGHSRGGRQSLFASRRLADEGIAVDLILTTDVALPPPVPPNVRHAINLYLTRPRLYPARPLMRGEGAEAIENIDLDAERLLCDAKHLNHLTITDSREVQEYLYGRIMEVMFEASTGQRR